MGIRYPRLHDTWTVNIGYFMVRDVSLAIPLYYIPWYVTCHSRFPDRIFHDTWTVTRDSRSDFPRYVKYHFGFPFRIFPVREVSLGNPDQILHGTWSIIWDSPIGYFPERELSLLVSQHHNTSEFHHNIVKVVFNSYFDNVMTKFMINNRTDAWKTDVNLLTSQGFYWLVAWAYVTTRMAKKNIQKRTLLSFLTISLNQLWFNKQNNELKQSFLPSSHVIDRNVATRNGYFWGRCSLHFVLLNIFDGSSSPKT